LHKLIVVGSGIKSIAHLTEETKVVIQKADKVLYLVNEENLKSWIQREAQEAESLEPIYFKFHKRTDSYHHITTHIVNEYQKFKTLCVVLYGHPTVFAESALNAVKMIKADKGNAFILPAVSSMDCLFSDLEIDPGEQGCFIIDATELLIYERSVDIHAHNLFCQISNLGMYDIKQTQKLNVLCDYLSNYYPQNTPVCIYEAATLPLRKPRIEWVKLHELKQVEVKPASTLYVPPITQKAISKKYLALLGMDIQDFKLSTESYTPSK